MSISPCAPVQLTLLSSILGGDFPLALERQRALGLRFLDLKDGIWGKTVEQLNEGEAARAAALIGEFGLQVHCFSTSIGHTNLEASTDEAAFRARYDAALDNALRAAEIMRPQVLRLLAPRLASANGEIAMARLLREFPWLIGVYRDWIDRITAAGFGVLIENEVRGCLLASVEDVVAFFAALDRPATARYTWDVQNLWQNGTFPTLEVYRRLRPLMGALHLKGGRADARGALKWAAPHDEASWPVLDIVRAVVADGVAPFICLNPSHGEKPAGWNGWDVAQREVAWLRRAIKEIA
ncbi:MAG: xylose isomerase [Armatimonadota bacterium]|nr:xylose isomerase [Armatimonadota bacterium]